MMELIVWLPEAALLPDQAPVALQLEALLEDQVSSVDPAGTTESGAALNKTVGAGGVPGGGVLTTDAELVPLPPQPANVSASTETSSNGFMRGTGN